MHDQTVVDQKHVSALPWERNRFLGHCSTGLQDRFAIHRCSVTTDDGFFGYISTVGPPRVAATTELKKVLIPDRDSVRIAFPGRFREGIRYPTTAKWYRDPAFCPRQSLGLPQGRWSARNAR